MAFLFPLGETILNAVEAGAAGNMLNAVYKEFEPAIKDLSTDKASDLIGDYAKSNPNGYVDNMVEKSYNHRKKRGRRVG
jgi:hypothetical protein